MDKILPKIYQPYPKESSPSCISVKKEEKKVVVNINMANSKKRQPGRPKKHLQLAAARAREARRTERVQDDDTDTLTKWDGTISNDMNASCNPSFRENEHPEAIESESESDSLDDS